MCGGAWAAGACTPVVLGFQELSMLLKVAELLAGCMEHLLQFFQRHQAILCTTTLNHNQHNQGQFKHFEQCCRRTMPKHTNADTPETQSTSFNAC